jgi:hypothetical protein
MWCFTSDDIAGSGLGFDIDGASHKLCNHYIIKRAE